MPIRSIVSVHQFRRTNCMRKSSAPGVVLELGSNEEAHAPHGDVATQSRQYLAFA